MKDQGQLKFTWYVFKAGPLHNYLILQQKIQSETSEFQFLQVNLDCDTCVFKIHRIFLSNSCYMCRFSLQNSHEVIPSIYWPFTFYIKTINSSIFNQLSQLSKTKHKQTKKFPPSKTNFLIRSRALKNIDY